MELSIVTINFNNTTGLAKTIESVVNQEFKNFEWIIIDGGSTDASKELILDNLTHVNFWVSEKDQGIYDAMNKGIKASTRDYILFLNSGDYFYTNEATKIIDTIDRNTDFVIFDYMKKMTSDILKIEQNVVPRSYLIDGMFCHQSVLHKRTLFDKIGLYDTSYEIAADYALFLKGFFEHNATFNYINKALVLYDDTEGISDYNVVTESIYVNERIKAKKSVFANEIIETLASRDILINELNQSKYNYDGLLNSKLIQLTISVIQLKNYFIKIVKKLFQIKNNLV
tara:strand:+ start:279 stop:1130 length:852 start_codon:yes stop_codon:yes gene_type:complete